MKIGSIKGIAMVCFSGALLHANAGVALAQTALDKPWFNVERTNMFIAVLVLSCMIVYYIYRASKGDKIFIRRIAGLSALDEAVGRATEMGKPVLYISGIMDMDDIQTLAGLSILGHVSQKTAEYDTPILVPCSRSLVFSTSQEIVKESYSKAGRPDAYRSENVRYLTDDQFGFVAGVDGIMLREEPAANFYLGCFYAESLILAETGNSIGSIQIAGTAMPSQLPFFVAACDYTLIGEELFAASAYISGDPKQMGALKGQDMGKAIIMIIIIVGIALNTFGSISYGPNYRYKTRSLKDGRREVVVSTVTDANGTKNEAELSFFGRFNNLFVPK